MGLRRGERNQEGVKGEKLKGYVQPTRGGTYLLYTTATWCTNYF
jgi:hypothetical protein